MFMFLLGIAACIAVVYISALLEQLAAEKAKADADRLRELNRKKREDERTAITGQSGGDLAKPPIDVANRVINE